LLAVDNRMLDGVRIQESPTLQLGAVSGVLRWPKCRLPKSLFLAPSRRTLLPVLPVAAPWLRTSAGSCEVREESSVQVRTRTGRHWCSFRAPPFRTSPFVLGYTQSEPLRLTRPFRANRQLDPAIPGRRSQGRACPGLISPAPLGAEMHWISCRDERQYRVFVADRFAGRPSCTPECTPGCISRQDFLAEWPALRTGQPRGHRV
jgi:hypothetical protein